MAERVSQIFVVLFLMNWAVFRNTSQVFCKMFPNLDLPDIFPVSLGIWIFSEEDCRGGVSFSLCDTINMPYSS